MCRFAPNLPNLSAASLTQLDLSENRLCGVWENYKNSQWVQKGTYDATGINAIADALRVTASLTTLDLSFNKLGPEGGKALAPAIAGSASLKQLVLFDNNLGDEGEAAIREAVKDKEGFELFI